MNIYRILSLALCPVFIFQLSMAAPGADTLNSGFKPREIAKMNGFKNTHQLFTTALTGVKIPPGLAAAMKAQLNKKSIPLPELKPMVDGTVQFQFQNKTHSLSRDSGNRYRLDGKLVDLNSNDWPTEVSFQVLPLFGLPLVIDSAEAVAPLAILVYGALIVILGGVVCSAPDIKISGAKTISLGDTAAERAINDMIRNARQQVCKGGCDIACAAPAGGEFDHLAYLDGLCTEVAKKFTSVEAVERGAQEFERTVNARQVRRTQLMAEVSRVNTQRSQTLMLDGVDQQILSGLTSDPDIMKWCVSKTLASPAEDAPAGNRAPAVVQ
jgi:hypothetical protein